MMTTMEPCPHCDGTGTRITPPPPMPSRGTSPGRKNGVRRHGYESTYQWGCRCELCRAAHREYSRQRQRMPDDSGWRRIAREQILRVPWCECLGCSLHVGPCGAVDDLACDHVIPRILGGTVADGLQTLCRPCNSSKGGKLAEER